MSTPRDESARFFGWALPLAIGISLAVGGLWWVITIRQISAPFTALRDGPREIILEPGNRTPAFAKLPPPLRDALRETLRTGQVRFGEPPAELAEWQRLAGDSHLVRAVVAARAGSREEAEREFAAFAAENPGSSLAQDLLGQARR